MPKSDPAGRPTPPAPALDIAWLLIETWRDKSQHIEGIALTYEAKDAFMRGYYEPGQSRSALPHKIIGLRSSAAPPRAQTPEQIELWRCERCWQWLRVAWDGCACTTVDVPDDPSERTVQRYFAARPSSPDVEQEKK